MYFLKQIGFMTIFGVLAAQTIGATPASDSTTFVTAPAVQELDARAVGRTTFVQAFNGEGCTGEDVWIRVAGMETVVCYTTSADMKLKSIKVPLSGCTTKVWRDEKCQERPIEIPDSSCVSAEFESVSVICDTN